ncbi:MAG: iron complex outermembrane receptor protein [Marinomonas primoryensis]|jgi:iron complex outermembrane receptor protein
MSVQSTLASAQKYAIEEVVVTAQKREQNLQEVPISVSAITERGLEKAGVSSTQDLNVVVPGLNVTQQLSSIAPILRGIGNYNSAPGAEGAIAMYVDGIYMPDAYGGLMSLANIDRIEVLRGPQGTLFGRNATGGLIHIITKTPSHENGGRFSISYGSQDTVEAKLYGTVGLSETVASDLGIFVRNQGDGFGENLVTGNKAIYRDEFVAKTKTLIEPSDGTRITLMADYSNSESDLGVARKPAEGTVTILGTPPVGKFHDVNRAQDDYSEREEWGGAARFEKEINSLDVLASLSYRESETDFTTDQGEGPVAFIPTMLPVMSNSVTGEFQVKSSDSDSVEWITGLYFFDSKDGVYPLGLSGPGFTALSGGGLSASDKTAEQATRSYSIFGESRISLGENTDITAGLRFTYDDREYYSQTVLTQVSGDQINQPSIRKDDVFKEPSWRLSINHYFNNDFMAYGSYSRGFKSGMYSTFSADGDRVDAETLDAFEIGFKSEFFENRIRLNGASYFYQYNDLQLTTQVAGANVLTNAAKAESKGVELELVAALSEHWELNSNVAWNSAKFKSFPLADITTTNPSLQECTPGVPASATPNCVSKGSVAGRSLPRAPELTFSVGLSYEREVTHGTLGGNINYYYNDGFYNDFANRFEQDSYNLINGRLFLNTGMNSQYTISLYGKNLMDEEYYSYATTTAFGDIISPAFGRQVGIEFSYEF